MYQEKIKKALSELGYHPSSLLAFTMQAIKEEADLEINSTESPLMLSLETTFATARALDDSGHVRARKLYPSLATTWEDLLPSMNDDDHANRLSSPAEDHVVTLNMKVEDLKRLAVTDPATNNKRLVIPEDTTVTIDSVPFYIYNPINIFIYNDDQFHVAFDLSDQSPLKDIKNDKLNWSILKDSKRKLILSVEIPCDQVGVNFYSKPLDEFGFNEIYAFSDNFYACEITHYKDGEWIDIDCVWSEFNVNSSNVTAVLSLYDGSVKIHIPEVYFLSGQTGNKIRIKIYTTKGAVNMSPEEMTSDSHVVNFNSFTLRNQEYYSPLKRLSALEAFSHTKVESGSNGLDFDRIKENVITGSSGSDSISVLPSDIRTAAAKRGFKLAAFYESLSGAHYLANKRYMSGSIVGGINSKTEMLELPTDLSFYSESIIEEGSLKTILPNALFNCENGCSVVTDAELNQIDAMSGFAKAQYLNDREYFTQPFYVCLDTNVSPTSVRSFHAAPSITRRRFLEDNTSSGLYLNTEAISIELVNNEFIITITAKAIKDLADVFFLIKTLDGNGNTLYRRAETITVDETDVTAVFRLEWDRTISKNDVLNFTNLYSQFDVQIPASLGADTKFEFIAGVESDVLDQTNIDNNVPASLYSNRVVGLLHEEFTAQLVREVKYYKHVAIDTLTEETYRTHTTDLPEVYENDIYETDEFGVAKMEIRDGEVILNKLHSKGDPTGEYVYRAGELYRTPEGELEVVQPSTLTTMLVLPLFDAAINYGQMRDGKKEIDLAEEIYLDSTGDVDKLNRLTADEAAYISFGPLETVGNTYAVDEKGEVGQIRSDVSLSFSMLMTEEGYNEEGIINKAKADIDTLLEKSMTKNSLSSGEIAKLNEDNPELLVVTTEGLPNSNYISVQEDHKGLAIRQKLELTENGTLQIVEAVTKNPNKI